MAIRGITVNAVAPGYVLTRVSKGLSKWSNTTKKTNITNATTAAAADGRSSDSSGCHAKFKGKEGENNDNGNSDGSDDEKTLTNLPILLRRMGNADDMGGGGVLYWYDTCR